MTFCPAVSCPSSVRRKTVARSASCCAVAAGCVLGCVAGPVVGGNGCEVGWFVTPGVEELELDREEADSVRTERFLRACGVRREDVAEILRSARVAAGRARTVVLQVQRGEGQAEVALHREHLAYLHAPRESIEVAR